MERRLENVLRKIAAFLEENGYRYAIVGGIALSHWGVVRATYDIDIKVLVPDLNYSAIRSALRAAFPERARAHLPPKSLIVSAEIDGVTVDFLLALPGYEELIIQRAVQRDMGGWTAWICSAEDLIIQKAVSGRPRDWSDVEALLRERCDSLDKVYIEEWLKQFAEALGKPEILANYRQLLARTGG
ncbi:MAG: nucleotidyltransferase [Anaerolineae bacterium]|nr:nucleotidyltransferase [Anaerolineae bacterium]